MNLELARRAVACKRWRWMPGMRAIGDLFRREGRVCAIVGECIELALDEREAEGDDPYGWHDQVHSSIGGIQIDGESRWNHLPDLTDSATLGCLLALVREAWDMTTIYVEANFGPNDVHWQAFTPDRAVCGNTEAEALVAALEAAP